MGKSTITMAIFNSYVKLPEGSGGRLLWLFSGDYCNWGVVEMVWTVTGWTWSFIGL